MISDKFNVHVEGALQLKIEAKSAFFMANFSLIC